MKTRTAAAVVASLLVGAAPALAENPPCGYWVECHPHGNCTVCWESDSGAVVCEIIPYDEVLLVIPACLGLPSLPGELDHTGLLGPQDFTASLPDTRPQQLQLFQPPEPPPPSTPASDLTSPPGSTSD